jgi:hypothetical protein
MATPQQRLAEAERLRALGESINDQQKEQLDLLDAANERYAQQISSVKDLSSYLQKSLQIEGKMAESFDDMFRAFAPVNDKAGDLYKSLTKLNNPLSAGYELLKLSVERFIALDNVAQKFRETTGFLASQTGEVESNIRIASRDLSQFGVTAELAGESAQQLANAFGDTSIANKENIEYVSLMKQNLGVSAEDSTAIMQNFMGIGGMSSKVARETAGAAASMAKAAGVPFSKVMQEVAKPSETVRSLIRGSVDGLIKGVIEAKRLGTSLESVGKAAAGMLDFQSSINDEMEASVLFGRDINLQKARELAYAGDLENLAKEQSRLLKEAGDVSKMDYFQRIGIAKALGMSVEEMDKMNAKQQELNQLRLEDPETYEKLTAKQKVMDKTKESLSEKYKKELLSQQLASQQEKIMMSIQSITTELAEAFLPIINTLVPIVGILFKMSMIITKLILAPFRLIVDLIDAGLKALKPYIDVLKLIEDGFNEVSSIFSDTPDEIENWGKKIGVALAGAVVLGFGIFAFESVMGGIVGLITSPFKLALKLIPNYFKGGLKDAAKGAVDAAEGAVDAAKNITSTGGTPAIPGAAGGTPAIPGTAGAAGGIPSVPPTANKTAGQNIKDFLKNLADGIKSFNPLGEILKGLLGIAASGPAFLLFITAIPGILLMAAVGAMGPLIVGGFTALSTGIKMMDIAKIGMGVLGILALGAAFIPFTFALSLLTGVSPTAILASVAAMYALGAGAIFLGSIFASGIGAALFFAGVAGIAALGAAFIPFGKASQMAGEGMKNFGDGVKDIAANISQISSLEETLSIFKDQELIAGIYSMGFAIAFLNTQLSALGTNLPALAEINKSKNEQSANGEVVAKLDELIGLMQSGAIAVNIDGTKVSTAVGVATRLRGSF